MNDEQLRVQLLNFKQNADATGESSAESGVPSQSARKRLKQGFTSGLTFYEYLLLASLMIVTIATDPDVF